MLAAARAGWSLVTVRGRGVRISDLAIDGGRRAERAIGVAGGSHDVRLQRLRVRGVRESAIEIWGAHSGVSIQDSVLDGAGADGAGVVDLGSDDSRDTSVIRSDISGFRGYGINFVQRAYDRPARRAERARARQPHPATSTIPAPPTARTRAASGPAASAAAIIGNRIRDTGWDGIQTVGTSHGVTVVDNDVARTGTGIYLEHETNDSLFARNVIADVATGINVEWRYEGAGSSGNTFEHNTVVRPTDAGIFVDVAGDENRIAANVVAGGSGPAVVLQGASDNLVRRQPRVRTRGRAPRGGAERAPRRRRRRSLAAQPHRRQPRAASHVRTTVGTGTRCGCSARRSPGTPATSSSVLMLARGLAPHDRGAVAFVTVSALVISSLASFGAAEATKVFVARRPAERSRLLSNVVLASALRSARRRWYRLRRAARAGRRAAGRAWAGSSWRRSSPARRRGHRRSPRWRSCRAAAASSPTRRVLAAGPWAVRRAGRRDWSRAQA